MQLGVAFLQSKMLFCQQLLPKCKNIAFLRQGNCEIVTCSARKQSLENTFFKEKLCKIVICYRILEIKLCPIGVFFV